MNKNNIDGFFAQLLMKRIYWIMGIIILLGYTSLIIYKDTKITSYCARVKYYNPNTGTRSKYYEKIEVQNEKLVKIYFGKGKYLDKHHFASDNTIHYNQVIVKSEEGCIYDVKILSDLDCSKYDLETLNLLDDNEDESEDDPNTHPFR
jgi:hypothetical protein